MKKLAVLFCLLIVLFSSGLYAQMRSLPTVSNEVLFYRGLKIYSDEELRFRDTGIYLESSVDGQLDIIADTEVQIAATTLDINATTVDLGASNLNLGSGFWSNVPLVYYVDPTEAFVYMEDFVPALLDSADGVQTGASTHGAQVATNATLRGWKSAGDAGWTITQPAGSIGGLLTLTCVTGSNNEYYTQLGELGTETYVEYVDSTNLSSWVEFKVSSDDITASAAPWFVGLAEEGSAAANFLNDDGADFADKDLVGFYQAEANEDTVMFVYQTTGGAYVRDTLAVLVAGTYYRYGLHFDGVTTLDVYIDGTQVTTVDIEAAGFPDAEELSPIVAVKQGAQDRILGLDWVKIVNER